MVKPIAWFELVPSALKLNIHGFLMAPSADCSASMFDSQVIRRRLRLGGFEEGLRKIWESLPSVVLSVPALTLLLGAQAQRLVRTQSFRSVPGEGRAADVENNVPIKMLIKNSRPCDDNRIE